MLLRMRTAVGNGAEIVDLAGNDEIQLGDEEIKVLVRMIAEMEASAKERALAADEARARLDRAREGNVIPDYNAFILDSSKEEAEEQAQWESACRVIWPDDQSFEYSSTVAAGETIEDHDDTNNPPSYRFTPRSQRMHHSSLEGGVGRGARRGVAGRAKILFRTALARHNIQQKALLFEAASRSLAVEEAGTGCQHLSLQHNALGPRSAAHLGALLRSSNTLQTLALGCSPLGDAGATLIGRALPHTRTLHTLALQVRWPWMAADGRGWPRMAADGHGWPRMAADGRGWPWMAALIIASPPSSSHRACSRAAGLQRDVGGRAAPCGGRRP